MHKNDKKEVTISLKLSSAEAEYLKQNAQKNKQSMSEFIRESVFLGRGF